MMNNEQHQRSDYLYTQHVTYLYKVNVQPLLMVIVVHFVALGTIE